MTAPRPAWWSTIDLNALFAVMRVLDAECLDLMKRATHLTSGEGVAVGAGHLDDLLASEARREVLTALRRGDTVDEAEAAARAAIRRAVETHNAQRSRDAHWQRHPDYGESWVGNVCARVRRAISPPADPS